MIVIGADAHKRSHTCGAVEAPAGQLRGELTAPARASGFEQLLAWSWDIGPERIWAIENCRISGSFERFLVARGECVVRVPPKLMAGTRKSARQRDKSDSIDALAVARAALREGIDTLPGPHLDERSLEVKLLLDHREDLVKDRTATQRRLRWHPYDLWPEFEIPAGALDHLRWLDRIAGKLARAEQSARVRVARGQPVSIRRLSKPAGELQRELEALVRAICPEPLELSGCSTRTVAKLRGPRSVTLPG
jgi:transposase